MRNIGILFLLSVSLVACDKAKYDVSGPTPETLEVELENTEKAPDGTATFNEFSLPVEAFTGRCLSEDNTKDASIFGYELVVVIDKAKDGQTFKVYKNGELVGDWMTSTGRELKEAEETKSGSYSRMITPTGIFTPTKGRLYENYTSYTWKTDMPYAIFFNGGVAIHETNQTQYLGSRASGGCVRLHEDVAEDFFKMVKFESGMGKTVALDRNGCVKKTTEGMPQVVEGYRTLIIVRDSSN